MIDQNLKTRLRKISASGLKVAEMTPPADIPTALEAWKRVVSVETVPAASVSQRLADALTEVDHQWFQHALSNSLFDTNGSFLISVAGPGSLELGWTPVLRTDREHLASQLQYQGGPEFVGMSLDGRCICAVTTEEYDYWIVVHHFE